MEVPETPVIVSENFVDTVLRLDPASGPYDTDRGYGVVAGKTIHDGGQTTVVLNNAFVVDASGIDLERLVVHEGGHVLLHAQGESGPSTLR